MDETYYLFLAIGWVAFVGLGVYAAAQKGRLATEAIVISGVFGPFGVLILALLPTLSA